MDVSSLVSLSTLSSNSRVQSALSAAADPAGEALGRAQRRVEQQRDSTRVQISAYGKLKSAVATLQTAGQALTDSKKTAEVADLKKAASEFVNAYNAAGKAAAGAGDLRTQFSANNLRRALGGENIDLGRLGISQGQGGTLVLDSKALDQALEADAGRVRETLSQVGGQVEQAAGRELGGGGNVSTGLNSLERRGRSLDAQLAVQQTRAEESQRNVRQQTGYLNNALQALAAYQRAALF